MDSDVGVDCQQQTTIFRLFTKESVTKIERCIAAEKAAREQAKAEKLARKDERHEEEEEEAPKPNPLFEQGNPLPPRYSDVPPELFGKPIEDIDDFYKDKHTFVVIGKDKIIYRFSSQNAFFVLSPFNPIRRAMIYVLTHPMFSLLVMSVILVNCVIMAIDYEDPAFEITFTVIYTLEGVVKMLSRGFVLEHFTYLRDAWNWLDFVVVTLAYVTMAIELGNLAALRTFRVLRALKTVAVVPGLKTIVGALMEAVRRLRDVGILTVFVLSIFALTGLQIYQGTLKRKCVNTPPENITDEEYYLFIKNDTNWYMPDEVPLLCGNSSGSGTCPAGTTCLTIGPNPNFGYTNFDTFYWAFLCAFRLMTQDFWESLYQMVIRTNGPMSLPFFILVIFLGSFYLVNLILAIVAMSYDEQQKQDEEDAREEEEDEVSGILAAGAHMDKSPSAIFAAAANYTGFQTNQNAPDANERHSIKSDDIYMDKRRRLNIVYNKDYKASLSAPQSPFLRRRHSQLSQFSWRRKPGVSPRSSDRQPLFTPFLLNLDLPYADDSNAVTPTSEELCNWQNIHGGAGGNVVPTRRRLSSASHASRISHYSPDYQTTVRASPRLADRRLGVGVGDGPTMARGEPTHFQWNVSFRDRPRRRSRQHPPEVVVDKTKSEDNGSSSSGSECDTAKGKLFPDNPFVCGSRTPSAVILDRKDVLLLTDLVDDASRTSGLQSEEKKPFRDFMKHRLLPLICHWNCSPHWDKFAHICELFILDAFTDMFITLCIGVNTLFMSMDYYGMSDQLANVLLNGNYVFTVIFTAEAVFKVIALSPINYFKDKWNCFDSFIVVLSLVELMLAEVKGLSILRSFRLLRVFKLAKSWPTLNLLIGIIGRTMGALGNLCFVLAIIIFIFAVMGMKLFGKSYTAEKFADVHTGVPRWNFHDFTHSFMIVFRVLCGEWIESMWDCMHCFSVVCVPFFLLTMVIGNLVVLNLFLALLLSSFGAESLQNSQEDASGPNKLQEAVARITRFTIFVKSHVMYFIKVKIRRRRVINDLGPPPITSTDKLGSKELAPPLDNGRLYETDPNMDEFGRCNHRDYRSLSLRVVKGTGRSRVGYVPVSSYEPTDDNDRKISERPRSASLVSDSTAKLSTSHVCRSTSAHSNVSRPLSTKPGVLTPSLASSLADSKDDLDSIEQGPVDANEGLEINEVNVIFVKYPDECCPKCVHTIMPCCNNVHATAIGRVWWAYRCYTYRLVEHSYFETFIILMIIISSLALAVEDIDFQNKPTHVLVLGIMDKIFTVIFVLEMIFKMSAFGFKKYFTDAWCWLDFVIVVISLVSLAAEATGANQVSSFRALRTLRALRPLRAVSRWEGMKVVVNALIQAIPAIFNVLVVCLVFWLIFCIMGVQLFNGRFHFCADAVGDMINHTIVQNKSVCESLAHLNYTWTNPTVNFDNVPAAYLALFQVATFKGWIDIMYHAIDARKLHEQPKIENAPAMYYFFVLFIVFGAFFTLNLFIGVIIDNFNMQKKKAGGSLEMFMTEDQKKYYNAMKKLGSKAPQKPIPKPRLQCQLFFFKLTTNQKFDIAIMSVIMMNMLAMGLEHYGQSEEFTDVLQYINTVFIAVFTVECVMKLIGLRWYYFKAPWNVFDFVIVVLSIFGLAMADIVKNYLVSPTLLRVVRVFRVGRVLRLVKSAKGIRTLLFSLAVSLPALINIGLLLFLVMFIFAIFGMNFFMYVKYAYGIDSLFNFETFLHSMILLFQCSTSAGWDGVLAGISNTEDCDPTPKTNRPNGDCGSPSAGVMFLISYLVISFLVIINMYIAVILENFSQATEDVQQGLTQDDFDMYYEIWERYDEEATQYIPLAQLSDFVDALEEPLHISAPNYYKLVSLNITICEGDLVHCNDILNALTNNFLGTGDCDLNEVAGGGGPERPNYFPVSSTLDRQRQITCVKIVQRAWRNYVKRKQKERMAQPLIEAAEQTIINVEHVNGDTPTSGDNSRTVELYPESSIVV